MTKAKCVNQMLQQFPKMLHKCNLGTATLASTTKPPTPIQNGYLRQHASDAMAPASQY